MENMKTKKVIIIGAGETATLAYEYFTYDSDYEVVAFSVNKVYRSVDTFLNLPVVDFENLENQFNMEDYFVFVALAGEKLNRNRTKLYQECKKKGFKIASYISSKAFVWHNVQIGENCFILENNVLQPFTVVGNNVTMWSGNHLGHRSIIKDNCFITSHVVISGFCEIGENTYIGVNSCIADNVKIGCDNYIAMGSSINKNTKSNSMFSSDHSKNLKLNTLEVFDVEDKQNG